jgi:anti-anti-sigma factor
MLTMVEGGLRIDVGHRPWEVVVALRGELDVRNVGLLRRAFSNLDPAYGAAVAVDCSQLGFIGAAGIGAIAAAAGALRSEGHSLHLTRPSDFVRQLFLLTGLGFLLSEPETPDSRTAWRRQPRRAGGRSADQPAFPPVTAGIGA